MQYYKVTIETTEEGLEEITGVLMSLDITETVIDNPQTAVEILSKKNEYDWDYVDDDFVDLNAIPIISFYLEKTEVNKEKVNLVENKIASLKSITDNIDLGSLNIEIETIDDQDWMNSYKEHFKTIKLCESVIVQPSWEEEKISDGLKVIDLDPGMAFGTGDHETTSMCAQLMEEVSCEGKDILDVGTGSGILAIAGSLLGGEKILGVDIDDLAVEVAAYNVEKNNVNNVEIRKGDLTKGIDFEADIVVANLMAEMVVMLSKAVKKHMKEDAVFISSGILIEKQQMVIDGLNKSGLEVVKVIERGDWSAILAK